MPNRFMTSGDRAPRPDVRAEVRYLRSVPTLRDAPESMLRAMVETGYVVDVRPDWVLMAERTAPEKAYVLLEGAVEVRRAGADVGACRPGEILGELGIVGRKLRSATVITRGPIKGLHLSRTAFEDLYVRESYFRALVGEAVQRKVA